MFKFQLSVGFEYPQGMSQEPRWLDESEMAAWRNYILTSRRLYEGLEAALAPHGLSMSDYEVLAQLSDAPERRMRMGDLAQAALLSKSRLSHRMKVMQRSGLIERVPCDDDRRGYFAVMTDKGWQAVVAAAPDHVESVRALFLDQLDENEQEVLATGFARIWDSLRDSACAEPDVDGQCS